MAASVDMDMRAMSIMAEMCIWSASMTKKVSANVSRNGIRGSRHSVRCHQQKCRRSESETLNATVSGET